MAAGLRPGAPGGPAWRPRARARAPGAKARPDSAAAMSLDTGELASETGDDSLSVATLESDFETKTKRKSFHKPPPTSPKSPYQSKVRKVTSWRPLRTATTMPLGSRAAITTQRLWLGSSKQASLVQPLKSELTSEHPWTSPPRDTPDYLTEALRMKRCSLRRSASNGHAPGTPVYREKEDMYDEIIELKKSLHVQKSDVDLLRTKLRRLEEENNRKDRQIEQLLDPSRGPEFIRTLTEKRPDTIWVINGLKQRILKLEQQCKDKDSTISKLQSDMKTTNLEEMRIAMETYYEEIHRLQTLLANSETTGRRLPGDKKVGARRQKKVSSALLNLSRSVQELTEENQSLKEDLDRLLSNSPTISKMKGYVEWSKPRLLRRIAELEKKLSSMEPSGSQTANPLAPSACSPGTHQQPEEVEHLRNTVRSLRAERSNLQSQLLEKDGEVRLLLQVKADLQKELDTLKEGESRRMEQEEALRQEVQMLLKKVEALQAASTEGHKEPVEAAPKDQEEPSTLQAPHQSSPPRGANTEPWASLCSESRRDAAARTLQAHWKAHRREKSFVPCVPSPQCQAQEEAVTVVQSVLRAHLARTCPSIAGLRRTPSMAKMMSASATPQDPSSTGPVVIPAGEDSKVSSRETMGGPATEDDEPSPWMVATLVAPHPGPGPPAPSNAQSPPPPADISSDDSDEVVVPPFVPRRKAPSPP
ncbi:IQ domain-containing protein E [Suncus etruscus]|uniref:IQ domain-containing protein E n=1 Tax=Suncus etruscus TaxID=109475 RepID=UPI002110205D|nr:IQ domain-containing protein E [Suncus etruscus]